jgi:hypothetical protein
MAKPLNSLRILQSLILLHDEQATPLARWLAPQKLPKSYRLPRWRVSPLMPVLNVVALFFGIWTACTLAVFFFRALGIAGLLIFTVLVPVGLSLVWVLPLAVMGGAGVGYSKTTQMWDFVMLTSLSRLAILRAHIAAPLRRWNNLIAHGVAWPTLIGIGFGFINFINNVRIPTQNANTFNLLLSVLLLLGFLGLYAALTIAERVQEIALAALIGLYLSIRYHERNMALVAGLAAGIGLRLCHLFFVMWLIPALMGVYNPFAGLTAYVGLGTQVLLLNPEHLLIALPVCIGFALLREIMVRRLYKHLIFILGNE